MLASMAAASPMRTAENWLVGDEVLLFSSVITL